MKEISGLKNFRNYLLEVEKQQGKRYFNCPRLIILPEDVLYKQELEDVGYKAEYLSDPELFRKGSLLCHIGDGNIPRCSTGGTQITRNEDGELETLCGHGGNKVIIEIKRFVPYREP